MVSVRLLMTESVTNDQAIEMTAFLDIRINDDRGRLEIVLAQWAIRFQYRDAVLLVQRDIQHDLVSPEGCQWCLDVHRP